MSKRVRILYICIALLFAYISFLDYFPYCVFLGPACLSYPQSEQLPGREGHLFSQCLVVLTNRSGCSIPAALMCPSTCLTCKTCLFPNPAVSHRCVCSGQLCLVPASLLSCVLQYPLYQILWDLSSNLRHLKLTPSSVTFKDLSTSLPVPAPEQQNVGRSLSQFHQQWDSIICKLSELLSLKGVKCHGILVFSGSAPHWALSCKLCMRFVRNDSCSLWHQHLGSNSTAKLPARKKACISSTVFAVGFSNQL